MLSGLGNFEVDCHILSTSSSSVFANVVSCLVSTFSRKNDRVNVSIGGV